MKIISKKNSLVIIGKEHNPTVFLGDFLIESGIIASIDEIDRDQTVITPAFGNIKITGSTSIKVQPEKLTIEDKFNDKPFKVGQKYCKNLPHIPYSAIGINLLLLVEDLDLDDLIPECRLKNYGINLLRTSFYTDNGVCNVSLSSIKKDRKKTQFDFNFHYPVGENISTLGKIDQHIDLLEEWENDKLEAHKFVKELTDKSN